MSPQWVATYRFMGFSIYLKSRTLLLTRGTGFIQSMPILHRVRFPFLSS